MGPGFWKHPPTHCVGGRRSYGNMAVENPKRKQSSQKKQENPKRKQSQKKKIILLFNNSVHKHRECGKHQWQGQTTLVWRQYGSQG